MRCQHRRAGPTRPALAAAAVVAIALAACSREETAARPRPAAPATANAPAPAAPPADVNEALKERLARQEAAARLFDKGKPDAPPAPGAPRAGGLMEKADALPAKADAPAAKAAEPVKKAATPVAPAAPQAAKPAPQPAPPPASAPPPPARAAPKVELAAAKAPPPPAAAPPARLLNRVDPGFPREAIQAGSDRGLVKARMTLDAGGNVTRVDVVEAQPRRHFDRAVVRALSQWKFDEGPGGRVVETEVEFRR